MRATHRVPVIFATLLILLGCAATADELEKAQSALAALRTDLQSGRIAKADIFFLSYTRWPTSTPWPTSPLATDRLERHHKTKKLSVELSAELRGGLIQAIDGTQLQLDQGGSDLRWGAVFFDGTGMRLHSIYLNTWYASVGAGRSGNIGEVDVKLNRSLIGWFETNFGTAMLSPLDIEYQRLACSVGVIIDCGL